MCIVYKHFNIRSDGVSLNGCIYVILLCPEVSSHNVLILISWGCTVVDPGFMKGGFQTTQPSRSGGKYPASCANTDRDAVCPAFEEIVTYCLHARFLTAIFMLGSSFGGDTAR